MSARSRSGLENAHGHEKYAGGRTGSPIEVLLAFLKLGVTSFGGPIAHIGYFRNEFVVRRRWLDEHAYADLVGLCQFLPGPASSQVGFTLGLIRAGYAGALAAWVGFTLPSAIALVLFAYGASALGGPVGAGLVHGLKLVAVSIVAQAVWGMARTLCPDRERAAIAIVAAMVMLFSGSPVVQIAVIAVGGGLGLLLCRKTLAATKLGHMGIHVSIRVGYAALALFLLLLFGLPVFRALGSSQGIAYAEAFYRSGALVFGGGHVVLPLLHEAFVSTGWLSDDAFLAGYGAVQAVPGPLFSFAAYLGFVVNAFPNGLAGAVLGLISLFLPGMLILLAALPFWNAFRQHLRARAVMGGVNAAVVGLLGAALYNPLWIGSIRTVADVALALFGFALLVFWRAPPLLVVIVSALGGIVLAMV